MNQYDQLMDKLEKAEAEVARLQQQLDIAKKVSRQFLSDSEWRAMQAELHRGGKTKL